MTENLNKKPPKGILKSSSSFDTASCGPGGGGTPALRRNSGVTCVSSGGDNISLGGGSGPNCSRQSSNELTVDGGATECCAAVGDNGEEYVHVRKHSKTAKFDEMNILETYHPATKTYGHMKIEEPKTPFNYYEDDEVEAVEGAAEASSSQSSKRRSKEINADELVRKLEDIEGGAAGGEDEPPINSSSEDEDADEDDESRAARVKFESKRKAHYNEYYAVKLARKLMEQEEDDDDDDKDNESEPGDASGPVKFIPEEETGVGAGDRGDNETMEQDG